jgi:hypothetical protein
MSGRAAARRRPRSWAAMRRIVTPVGIERLEKVRIGGIDQWISVRGFDRRNPILLYISSTGHLSSTFQEIARVRPATVRCSIEGLSGKRH